MAAKVANGAPVPPTKGRSKAAALDDMVQLRAIAALLAVNDALKPTAAIRQLGISDPTIIRRLRAKYQAMESELAKTDNPRDPIADNFIAATSSRLANRIPSSTIMGFIQA